MTNTKRIIIEIENTNVGDEPHTGADEALFDWGIENPSIGPDSSGEEWCNMRGMWYRVTNVTIEGD